MTFKNLIYYWQDRDWSTIVDICFASLLKYWCHLSILRVFGYELLCILRLRLTYRLRMSVKGSKMTWAESFRYLALKPSNLVALSVLRLWSCFKLKVSVTNGIENSGGFSKFTLTRSLIVFTSGCSIWSLILFSVLKFYVWK